MGFACIGLIGCLAALSATAQQQDPPVPDDDWKEVVLVERIAADLPLVDLGEFLRRGDIPTDLHGRGEEGRYPNIDRCNELLRALYASADRASEAVEIEVKRLIGDGDPRVRTTAILWLYQRFDPSVLPFLVEQIDDNGIGVPSADVMFDAFGRLRLRMHDLTVGQWARQLLSNYFRDAWSRDARTDFETYWRPREHRTHCLSWLSLRFAQFRMRDGTLDDKAARDAFARLQGLTGRERAIVELSILGETLTPDRAKDVAAEIGQDTLLDLIEGEPVIDDPDLPKHRNRLAAIVFQHAESMFEPAHADALARAALSLPRGDAPIAEGCMAAARLNPEQAGVYLGDALVRVDGAHEGTARARLMATLWTLSPIDETPLVHEWFYTEQPSGINRSEHAIFLQEILKTVNDKDRQLVKRLVEDPRFANADWWALVTLIEHFGKVFPERIAPDIDISHPMGTLTGEQDWSLAAERYPRETRDVQLILDTWREWLRSVVAEWTFS